MRSVLLWVVMMISCLNWAQELPPVRYFSPDSYGADNQNWMISQDSEGRIYVANNKGFLEYNGSSWSFYPTPNETVIRSIMIDDSRVYTGFYMGFGYWSRNHYGTLEYKALSEELGIEMIDDEQFWKIFTYDKYILFQSLDRIYIWDETQNSVSVIESEGDLVKLFQVDQAFFFQVMDKGLYTIVNGEKALVSDDPVFRSERLVGAFKKEDRLTFLSEKAGFFQIAGEEVLPLETTFDQNLGQITVYSFLPASNGDLILGTIANGVYHLNAEGDLKYHIDASGGLVNNTALSLFEDIDKNIWVGLDNGLACVNINSPIRNYRDATGALGTTYETSVHNGLLYLGTNQGLFYRTLNGEDPFQFVPGTSGQVWKLRIVNGELFCGHDSGTFLINDGDAQLVSQVGGTWDIKPIPGRSSNLLIQGNYSGLYVLERGADGWSLRNKLSGFDISSKDFEFSDNNELLLSHEYKGVYRLQLNDNLDQVLNFSRFTTVDKGPHASMTRYLDKILYANKDGVFSFDSAEGEFVKNSQLSGLLMGEDYVTGSLITDRFGRLWMFSKDFLFAISEDQLGEGFQVQRLSIPHELREEMVGHESIFTIGEQEAILGITNGYTRLNLQVDQLVNNNVSIDRVVFSSLNGQVRQVRLDSSVALQHKNNSLSVTYSVTNFEKYLRTEFQHRLMGWQEDWSDWQTENSTRFDNLPPGSYDFELRAKVNDQVSANIAQYSFEIKEPWYWTIQAKVFYVALSIIMLIGINLSYRQYYRKQRRKLLEEELKESKLRQLADKQEIMKLRNDKLRNEIESRNRELAVSTMSMINKNNTLSKIKSELIRIKGLEELQPVIQHIDNTLNDEDDWRLFEEAFNYADTDFFKKLKHKHSELTPNDLRLCVYLRLNLTSKEIAPLLNISPRSVEIKRYRLRKKLGLDSAVNLNEYFIAL